MEKKKIASIGYTMENSKKHACEELASIREELGLSMDKMAKLLGYATASGYAYYEDAAQYKKRYFENTFIAKLIEKLVPFGIKRERIESLGLVALTKYSETDEGLLYAIKEIIKLLLNEEKQPVTRERIRRDFISGLAKFHDAGLSTAVGVLDDLLEYVEGKQHLERPPMPQQPLRLAPPE